MIPPPRGALRLVLNGRFLSRPVTGVERLALELARAIAEVIETLGVTAAELLVATPSKHQEKARQGLKFAARVVGIGRLSGQAWEQIDLARYAPHAWLLGFCNLGPIGRRRQALVVCDAQIYRQPASYRLAFRVWYRIVTPILGRRVAALFTISHHSQRELEEVGAFPRGRSHVLRLGVDHIERIQPDACVIARHDLVTGTYLLAIGSLAPHKNLAMLVVAFLAADLDPMINLVIAGGGNSRVFADAGLPADPRIRYLGRVSDEELRALYGEAMAFACPALTEGFGLTPLEAMACGCPVIATTGGAVPEVCGDVALYADPGAPAAWTRAIETIARDRVLRDRLAGAARRHAATFRWRDAAIDLLEVLAAHDGDSAMLERLQRLRVGRLDCKPDAAQGPRSGDVILTANDKDDR